MRLICPNCGAQYEVPEEVVPQAGRDVQCSNCGDTWFQYHPDHMPDDDETLQTGGSGAEMADIGTETTRGPVPDNAASNVSAPQPDTRIAAEPDGLSGDVSLDETDFDAFDDDVAEPGAPDAQPTDIAPAVDAPAPKSRNVGLDDLPPLDARTDNDAGIETETVIGAAPPPPPARKNLKADVAAVLREEAEIEARARTGSGMGASMESQPDLGLDVAENDAERRDRESRQRMAKIKGQDPAKITTPQVTDPAAAASRRDLLPDIEEINSTLRRKGENDGPDTTLADFEDRQGRRRGFRQGFVLIVFLAIIAAIVYLQADRISQAVPQVEPYMNSYTEWVGQKRLQLDDKARDLMKSLDKWTSETTNP